MTGCESCPKSVPETLENFHTLTQLSARDFVELFRRESFKTVKTASLNKTHCWSHLERRSFSKINWTKFLLTQVVYENQTLILCSMHSPTAPCSADVPVLPNLQGVTIQRHSQPKLLCRLKTQHINSSARHTLHGAPSVLGRSQFLGQPTNPKHALTRSATHPQPKPRHSTLLSHPPF
jgi:hypothetical protein